MSGTIESLHEKVDALLEEVKQSNVYSEDIQDKINRVLGMLLGDAQRDIEMAKGQERLSGEIKELSDKVDEYTSAAGQRIEDAVAEAKAAWEADNEAAFNEAADKIDAIGKKLSSENPADPETPDFEPSQN